MNDTDTIKDKNIRQIFRFRSIFVTITGFILIDGLILCILFFVFSTETFLNNSRKNLEQTNQSYLSSVSSSTDYLISNLHQSLTQMSYSSNILGLVFSRSSDSTRVTNTKLELIYLADHTMLISESFLYIPYIDMVITSEKKEVSETLAEYKNSNLITDYQDGLVDCTALYENGKISSLFIDDGRLVIVRDFPLVGENRLASLYYIIDIAELEKQLQKEVPTDSEFAIYSNGSLLISSTGYPFPDESQLLALESDTEDILEDGDYVYFSLVSDTTGWRYVYAVDSSLFQFSLPDLFQSVLPALFIMISVSVLFAFLIAHVIYRPIYLLADTVETPEKPENTAQSPKNELEYFSLAYREALQKKTEANELLASISHDTMSRIFHNLMAGTMHDKDKLPTLLAAINSPYKSDSLYQIALIEFSSEKGDIEAAKIEYLGALSSLCLPLNEKYSSLSHPLMMYGTTYCIVFSFQRETSLVTVRRQKQEFCSAIDEFSRQKEINSFVAFGHLYRSLLDIPWSLKEAEETLAKQKAAGVSAETPKKDAPLKADIAAYAQNILNVILDNQTEDACELANRILDGIAAATPDAAVAGDEYILLISSLLDRIVALEYIDNLSLSTQEYTQIIESKKENADSSALLNLAKETCRSLITETGKLLKKQRNHYIVAAQKYISEHYTYYDLSLNSVSAAVDINASYLSRLFKNNLGIKFTDYLNQYRVSQSIELLKNTDKSIQKVSEETGFNSVQNYIRVFKKYTELTPRQYRDNFKKSKTEES